MQDVHSSLHSVSGGGSLGDSKGQLAGGRARAAGELTLHSYASGVHAQRGIV